MAEKIKEKIKELTDKGIPIFVFQDPITKLPSITFSFFLISGIITLLATLDSVKFFAGINFNESKEFFDMCSYVYLGRSAIKALLGNNSNSQNKT